MHVMIMRTYACVQAALWLAAAPVQVAAQANAAQPTAATEATPTDTAQSVIVREPGAGAVTRVDAAAATTKCLLRGFCLGPVITLGLVDVIGVGVHARHEYWGVGVDYQFMHFTTGRTPITLSLLTVEGRVYPFGGAFFLSVGVAWQHAGLSGSVTYRSDAGVSVNAEVDGRVDIPVLKLGIGLFGRSGLALGADLAVGVQLGGNRVQFGTDLPRFPEVIAAEDEIRRRADTWVRTLPFLLQLNLVRIGFLF